MSTPSTTICLARYPKPSGANQVVTYASYDARRASVASYAIHTSTGNYFVRPETGQLRVNAAYNDVEQANYGYFQNGGGKIYFFNVDHAEYVNDETTRIHFAIDVIATYYDDYDRTPQYVLREHADTDAAGDNLQPEPVGTGELTVDWQTKTASDPYTGVASSYSFDLREICAFIFAGDQPDGNQVYAGVLDGTVEGACVWAAPLPIDEGGHYYTGALSDWLWSMNRNNKAESVVAITAYPLALSNIAQADLYEVTPLFGTSGDQYSTGRVTFHVHDAPTTVDGYTPRNEKLLTYPYCFMRANNYKGQYRDLRYEFFGTAAEVGAPAMTIKGSPDPAGDIWCVPVNYNGCAAENPEFAVTMGGIPQVSWPFNSYQNWLAGNAGSLAMNLLGLAAMAIPGVGLLKTASTAAKAAGVVEGAVTGLTGTAARAATSTGVRAAAMSGAGNLNAISTGARMAGGAMLANTGSSALSFGASLYDQSRVPDGVRGQTTGAATAGYGCYGFSFLGMAVRREFAECIDDFFDMYGYATNEVKVPNETGRASWNYVQTQGAAFRPSPGSGVPAWAMDRINQLYDEGVWFWHSIATAGDYTQANGIV